MWTDVMPDRSTQLGLANRENVQRLDACIAPDALKFNYVSHDPGLSRYRSERSDCGLFGGLH